MYKKEYQIQIKQKKFLGFEAEVGLVDSVKEVISYMTKK